MSFYNSSFLSSDTDGELYTGQMQRTRYNMPSSSLVNVMVVINIILTIGILSYWITGGFLSNFGDTARKGLQDVGLQGGAGSSIIVIIFIILICVAVFLYFVVFPVFFNWNNVLRPDYNLMNTMQL